MAKVRILIVEDNMVVAKDIEADLQEMGYEEVFIANDGEEALFLQKDKTPDLVLMDINLPGSMDGIQVSEKFQERTKIPIIYITAHSDKDTISRAVKTNPHAYLIKPFNYRDLEVAINIAIENYVKGHSVQGSHPQKAKARSSSYHDSVFFKKENCFERIFVDEIYFAEASGSYCNVMTAKGKITLAINLSILESKLNHDAFLRVHRSFIANLDKIETFDQSSLTISGIEIPISKAHKQGFFEKMNTV